MKEPLQPEFIVEVLRFYAKIDCQGELFWNIHERQPLAMYVMCNDQFWWATADAEEITPENFGVLTQAVADCKAAAPKDVMAADYGLLLFCCRVRKMRPQGCCYPGDERLWPLFDAAGPERKPDMNNPYKRGERVRR